MTRVPSTIISKERDHEVKCFTFGGVSNEFLFLFSGGLFEHEYRGQELAFKYAIRKINERKDILPNISLQYDIQSTPAQDSFHASKKGKTLYYLMVRYTVPIP